MKKNKVERICSKPRFFHLGSLSTMVRDIGLIDHDQHFGRANDIKNATVHYT